MLISIKTHITFDFPGRSGPPITHSGSAHDLIMVCPIFLLLSGILDIQKKIWEYLSVHKGYCYCQGYWIFRKKYGNICQFIRDTCLFTSRNIVTPPPPPPSKPAFTIHGYFVSLTPHTVIRLLLYHCLMFLPFVYSPSLVLASVSSLDLQSSGRGYLVVLLMSKLWSVALSNVTVGCSAL